MGSCGNSMIVDDPASGGPVIELHLCSELQVECVPVQQTCSEETCNMLGPNVDLSSMIDGSMDSAVKQHLGSANIVDVTEGSGDALASECENADMLLLEKTSKGDGQNHSGMCCGNIEVPSLKSGRVCLEGNFQGEGNLDVPSESVTVNYLEKHCLQRVRQKDDDRIIFPSAGDDSAVAEYKSDDAGLLTDSLNCVSDFRHSEMPSESESPTDLVADGNQQNEQETMRTAAPTSRVVEKCDALGKLEANECKGNSPSQGMEVPSDVLYTEVESTSNQLCDQKDGKDWNSSFEEKVIDSHVQVLSLSGHRNTLECSLVVDSACKPTMLDQGNEMKSSVLQIEDNLCRQKDCPSEETANSTFRKPFYPKSGQPSVVLVTNSSPKVVPHLLRKDDDVSINNNNNAMDNPVKTDNGGKDTVEVDCITESRLLPSERSSQRAKVGRKTQTKKASRKCKNKASVTHPDEGMIIFEAAKKKRSCISKPARSSMWGLLGNVEQFFEQDNESRVGEAMSKDLGKARRKRQGGKGNKNGASSSLLDSLQKCSVSTTRVRLKIKIGKGYDLSCSNILIPEAVDGLASASHLGSVSGLQKVASDGEGKITDVVALGKLESSKNELDTDAVVLNGQISSSHLESTSVTEKSDVDAEEPCLLVPPEMVVESLIEPINNKGLDPGTSPDSEVINTIPEVQVGERHQEDEHHAVLDSSKEFNSNLEVPITKRGQRKDKLVHSGNCITEDRLQGPPSKNRPKHSKNRRRKKNFSDAVSSMELPTSMEINASSKSLNCKELSMEPLLPAGEIQLGDSTEALKDNVEVKTTCNPSVDQGFLEPLGSENLLSSARPLGRKLPKSLLPNKVRKTKSKASDSLIGKNATSRRKEKQKKPINKSEVKGKGVSHKEVTYVVEGHPLKANIARNHELDAVGKVNASDNRLPVNVSNLDMVPAVGLGEQHLSPHNAWVRCDDCHKWRRIPAGLADLINETNCTWTCKDSSDKAFADCAIPQEMSNAEINAELGLSDASGEEDGNEDSKNYKELDYRQPLVSQESTFTRIFTNEFLHRSSKTQTIDEIMVCHCKPPQDGKLGCGDECLNRMLNIECVQGTCPCGDCCSNQQFQKRNYARLRWFKCGKKGYGLKALENITKGQFLIEYIGEVLDMHAYEARQREYALKGHRHFYFMTLNGSEVIDASAKGNLGRFINHSCDPNCRTEKWMVNGEICIGLFALRDIKQGEEVTFDYNYVRVFGAAAKKCYCGSPQCRGYIGGGDPLDTELIVHGDSDEEFPEPVMLTEDGEIEDRVPAPEYFDNADTQSDKDLLNCEDVLDKSTIDVDGTPEKDSSLNPASAVSLLHCSSEVEGSKGTLQSPDQAEVISQQMEDVTSKPMPAVQPGYPLESELLDKTSSIQRLETVTPNTTVNKVLSISTGSNRELKSETGEGRHHYPQSKVLMKTPQLNGSVKKGKIRASPPNGLKAEVSANRLHVSSVKLKKVVEGSSNGRFEAVQEKLNELLDGDGGISKRKDSTKRYLKLLLLTVASGDRSNGEAIQSNRDLSMILDALLKTKSRAVLNDIINKNGLQMLHNIMKQYRQDFKKIPILRKLLKVLEYLAASKILTFEHINSGPPCHGMESFRESMLSLTEHDDKQVHQIARSFRDRWIPRPVRKHYMDRDDNRVESHRSFNCKRFSASHNHRHDQDVRPTEASDRIQQSTPMTTSVDAHPQEGCSAHSLDGVEYKGTKKRKRKSRWDQPAETNSYSDAVINSIDETQNIHEDAPPGFSCPVGSLNASLNLGDLALQNVSHSGCPSHSVIGHPKEKFNSLMPVSYGMPWFVVHQYGTPRAGMAETWVTAPGMPFNPFPPLPPYPRDVKDTDCQPSNAMAIDQPAENRQSDTSGPVKCSSDDMIPSTTGANPEDVNLPGEDNKHVSKRLKGDSYDLGTRFFRQQKWNNSKIRRPWFRRDAWKCDENNSGGDMCSIGVDVPKESKVTCYLEDATCRDDKGGNNIY